MDFHAICGQLLQKSMKYFPYFQIKILAKIVAHITADSVNLMRICCFAHFPYFLECSLFYCPLCIFVSVLETFRNEIWNAERAYQMSVASAASPLSLIALLFLNKPPSCFEQETSSPPASSAFPGSFQVQGVTFTSDNPRSHTDPRLPSHSSHILSDLPQGISTLRPPRLPLGAEKHGPAMGLCW